MKTISIPCRSILDPSFSAYGTAVYDEIRMPDANQEDLRFWNKLALLEHTGTTSVSIVQTYGKDGLVERHLERHGLTPELLIPSDDIIVVAALSRDDDPLQPDLGTVSAFSISRGQAAAFHRGVWHHAPLTVKEQVNTFVLFSQDTPEEDMLLVDLNGRYACEFEVLP